jgi:CRISPR-associated protein Cas6
MMVWEEKHDETYREPDTVVDATFNISCKALPLEHAFSLSTAVTSILPWLLEENNCAIHQIHGADSGNGWERPERTAEKNPIIYLSRRSKLTLRVPRERLPQLDKLLGITLDIEGYPLTVNQVNIKKINIFPILFSRYIITQPLQSEGEFIDQIQHSFKARGISCWKMLCGKSHPLHFPDGDILTRSLMIAELEPEDSIKLQYEGYGNDLIYGCGIFLPHKDIKPVERQ